MAMKRFCASVAILALSGGLALAQSGSAGGTSSSATPSAGTAGANAASQSQPGGAGSSAVPVNGLPAPGLSTTQPSDSLTVGRAPGVNPANPQDASRRGNPSDRTLTGARNSQDMKAFDSGTPQIITPERR